MSIKKDNNKKGEDNKNKYSISHSGQFIFIIALDSNILLWFIYLFIYLFIYFILAFTSFNSRILYFILLFNVLNLMIIY